MANPSRTQSDRPVSCGSRIPANEGRPWHVGLQRNAERDLSVATRVGAQWTFLSGPERTVQKDLDIAEYTDPEHNPTIPHTLVLKQGLIIHSIYNGYWFWGGPLFSTSGATCGP